MIQRDQIVGTDANLRLNIDELLRSYNRNLVGSETIAESEPNSVRGIQNAVVVKECFLRGNETAQQKVPAASRP